MARMRTLTLTLIAALAVAGVAYAAVPAATVDEVTASTVKFGSLQCGQTYRFRIWQRNSNGSYPSQFQEVVRSTAACPPPPPPADGDGDGVPDTADACPGTPAGTPVDSTGCPLPPPPPPGAYPDASNTGVPPGTALTAYTGPSTVTLAGTIIDSKTVGCLTV